MTETKVSKRLLVKSGFWYTVSNFLTKAMVFITMPVFTRLMSKDDYGNFGVFATWQAILLTICGIEVYATLNRARFDFTAERDLNGYITSSLLLSTTFTALIFALYLIFPQIFDRFFLLDRRYILCMFAYLFTCPAFTMFQAKQRIDYRYKLNAALSFFITIASSILALVLVIAMPEDRLLGRIVGQYGLTVVVGLLLYSFFVYRGHAVTLKAMKYALRIGVPFIFSYIGSQIMLASDNLVVRHMCAAEKVSYLSVTHTTSHIILLLVQTLNTAWSPWFYDMLKVGNHGEIKKVFRIYLWGAVACTFAVLLIGPEIIAILGGSRYRESIYLLPPVILNGIFSVLTMQLGSLETYYKKPEYATILTSILAVVNVGLNILGVRLWGYRAVCYTTIFCQIALIGAQYIVTQHMGIRKILSPRTLVGALAAAVALIPISLLLYQHNVARLLAILAICIACAAALVRWRREILQLIRKFRRAESVKSEGSSLQQ